MSIDLGRLVLKGKAVTLRPMEAEDAEGLASASGESREHYVYNPVPEEISGAREYVRLALRQRDEGQRYPFTIEWQTRIVGSTSYSDFEPWSWQAGSALQRIDRPDVCEIGYTWLAASAQRTGCNTEAKYLLLSHAFEKWQVHRVSLRTDVRNERSRRAIERLGAMFEGVRRCDKPASDATVRDSAFYSIIAAEWPRISVRLRELLAR